MCIYFRNIYISYRPVRSRKSCFFSRLLDRWAWVSYIAPTCPFQTELNAQMSLSMYQASVPVFIRTLTMLSNILDKAAAFAEAKKIDSAVLVNARLAPDMFPLSRQVQIATDNAKGCAARLAGIDPPRYEDTETTFPELIARLRKTVDFLATFKPAQIDGSEERTITLTMRHGTLVFPGQTYLLTYALPNVYFHVTTAYAILRHNGVEVGKQDFLGKF